MGDPIVNSIAKLVYNTRVHLRMDQRTVAGLACVSPKFLSQLENAKAALSLDKVLQVLNVLGLRVSPLNSSRIKLGEIVQTTRKAQTLDQAVAASLCGVSPKFLSQLENGKSSVRLDKVMAVLNGLGIKLKQENLST